MFIPLLLLAEKRILHIIKYGLISLAATIFQILFYYNNISFRNNFLVLADRKTGGLFELSLSPLNSSPYLIILFVVICIYAYIKNSDQEAEGYKTAIFISLLSYAILFSSVEWHPQWLIIIIPFFALAYLFVKDVMRSYLIDLLGMFAFIYIAVNCYPWNVDANMLQNGIFRSVFTYIPLSNSRLFLPQYVHTFMGVFFVYLFSPLLVQIFQKTNLNVQNDGGGFAQSNPYLRWRFYIGLAIFVIPTLFCAFAPPKIARRIDPDAYINSDNVNLNCDLPVGNIDRNDTISQSFTAENNNLFSINVKLATYARINNSEVTLTLLDQNNHPLAYQKINAKTLHDNAYFRFNFKPLEDSKGRMYYLEIKSDATDENSITAWKSKNDVYPPGGLYINGKEDTGDLCMQLFYEVQSIL